MARTGLDKSEVRKARDTLLMQGIHPSLDAVRVALGNTGSKSTIHKYLKEEERGDAKQSISDTLQDLVARLAEQLEREANLRVNEVKTDYESVRKALQAETIARHTAEQQVSDLKERLSENEAHWQAMQAEIRQSQQNLADKQDEITQLNRECTRLATELSHAKKTLVDQQSHGAEIEQRLGALQSVQRQHQMLNIEIADETAYNSERQFRSR